MSKNDAIRRVLVLDPIERVSEVVFGVLMAISFTGSLSVAHAGNAEVRTMISAALGCNLAWGLADAVMYLVGATTDRHRQQRLLRHLQATRDVRDAHRLIADWLPKRVAEGAGPDVLEALHKRLLNLTVRRRVLGWRDLGAAFALFLYVVLATFPVVLPFLLIRETLLALRISQLLALVTLVVGGAALGKYAGGSPWSYGFGLGAIGVGLIVAIMTLGG
jgi:VIT1/CCC1 family predicted Fe2+/Mn2+ transporter